MEGSVKASYRGKAKKIADMKFGNPTYKKESIW